MQDDDQALRDLAASVVRQALVDAAAARDTTGQGCYADHAPGECAAAFLQLDSPELELWASVLDVEPASLLKSIRSNRSAIAQRLRG